MKALGVRRDRLTTALGAVWLCRIQQHSDARAAISMAARPEPAWDEARGEMTAGVPPELGTAGTCELRAAARPS